MRSPVVGRHLLPNTFDVTEIAMIVRASRAHFVFSHFPSIKHNAQQRIALAPGETSHWNEVWPLADPRSTSTHAFLLRLTHQTLHNFVFVRTSMGSISFESPIGAIIIIIVCAAHAIDSARGGTVGHAAAERKQSDIKPTHFFHAASIAFRDSF